MVLLWEVEGLVQMGVWASIVEFRRAGGLGGLGELGQFNVNGWGVVSLRM